MDPLRSNHYPTPPPSPKKHLEKVETTEADCDLQKQHKVEIVGAVKFKLTIRRTRKYRHII